MKSKWIFTALLNFISLLFEEQLSQLTILRVGDRKSERARKSPWLFHFVNINHDYQLNYPAHWFLPPSVEDKSCQVLTLAQRYARASQELGHRGHGFCPKTTYSPTLRALMERKWMEDKLAGLDMKRFQM